MQNGWAHLKLLFSRTTEQIVTILSTNHSWEQMIQVSSSEAKHPPPRGDNSKGVKIH
jgi:hypothetical protein